MEVSVLVVQELMGSRVTVTISAFSGPSAGHADGKADSALRLFLDEAKLLTSSPFPLMTMGHERAEQRCAQGRLWAHWVRWALGHNPGSRRGSAPLAQHLVLLAFLDTSLPCL